MRFESSAKPHPRTTSPVDSSLNSGSSTQAPPPKGVISVLSAADEVAVSIDMDTVLRRTVELARSCIGLERVSLWLRDRATVGLLRGAYGTDMAGETTSERDLFHEFCDTDAEELRSLLSRGKRWVTYPDMPLYARKDGAVVVVGRGWMASTPLVSGGDLVGVMYNDSAITNSAFDEGRQVRAAVFCSLIATLLRTRVVPQNPVAASVRKNRLSQVTQDVLRLLQETPGVSGRTLASRLAVSAGHLTRTFKDDMGISLVEHRNRLRIERFLGMVDQGGDNLYVAALDSGFGSYSQFYRVFCSTVGVTPSEYLTGQSSPELEDPSRMGGERVQPKEE